MRKIVACMLVGIFLLSAGACGGGEDSDEKPAPEPMYSSEEKFDIGMWVGVSDKIVEYDGAENGKRNSTHGRGVPREIRVDCGSRFHHRLSGIRVHALGYGSVQQKMSESCSRGGDQADHFHSCPQRLYDKGENACRIGA